MKQLLRHPYNWYLLSIPLLYAICVSASPEDSIDIQLHDTMFVISKYHFYILPTLILLAWAALHVLVYKVRKQDPNKIITSIHLVITLISPLFLVIPEPNQALSTAIIIYILAQLLFSIYTFSLLGWGLVLRLRANN